MTRGHAFDYQVVSHYFDQPARYLGMIGSKPKCTRTLERLVQEKHATDAQLQRILAPVGLAIGGSAPGEIAVSITAQMLMAKYRQGTDWRSVWAQRAEEAPETSDAVLLFRSHPMSMALRKQPSGAQ